MTPGPFYTFFYEDRDGTPGKRILAEAELDGIELIEVSDELRFDGDPLQFRLGVEAQHIQVAFTHEMAALAVSSIRPLAHQLEAVYGCFLREPRLRFLLADDPGAGKTIMAGLYMKELELRRAGDRILVVVPANLRFQWVRELHERFQLEFQMLEAAHFNASAVQNPWDLHDRVVVSRDFLRTERARAAFDAAEKPWDLAVIDEAHGFTVSVDGRGNIDRRTERYKAGEAVARRSHRLLLMTATPHSGRDESLWALLRLLDAEAFGDRMPRRPQPPSERMFRKVRKEQMLDLAGKPLFKPRHPKTLAFEITGRELDLYQAVTAFISVRLAQIRGQGDRSAAGFALTTMQRRLASSVRAIRRTLERRIDRLEKALADPAEYLRARKGFQDRVAAMREDIEDLDEDSLWALEEAALEASLPETVQALRAEREELQPLLALACALEDDPSVSERKLTELLDLVTSLRLGEDPAEKLLVFTEHKDTLDYLVEQLAPRFSVATIHGGMRLEERIEQERRFREDAQIMVATEAAGEGINLQFCHLMVNYDIPWNPNRLEQRMGRIHRIGQTEDVHIFNLVASNTREGYVLATLLRKLETMGERLGDSVFDVIGAVFAEYRLQDLIEQVLAGEITKETASELLGGQQVDPALRKRVDRLLQTALAQGHLDWRAERDRANRAEGSRLPPGYLERFFLEAVQFAGGKVRRRLDKGLQVERTPDALVVSSRASGALTRVAPSYAHLTFDKEVVERPRQGDEAKSPHAELCGPSHPLFDALLDHVIARTTSAVHSGAVFFDPDVTEPTVLHFLLGDVKDGNGELVHRSIAVARVMPDGRMERAPAVSLFDVVPPMDEVQPEGAPAPGRSHDPALETWARQHLFEREYRKAKTERGRAAAIQEDFLRRSFNQLITQAERSIIAAEEEAERQVPGAAGRLRLAELAKREHEARLRNRLEEVERGRDVRRDRVEVLGSALLLPLPAREETGDGVDRRGLADIEVEQIAVRVAREYEVRRGASVTSVEQEKVGFDLLSTLEEKRRFIEVKGRAGIGRVELTWSEYSKSVELGDDYWLYVVLDCLSPAPRLYRVQDPAKNLARAIHPELDVRFTIDPEPVIEAAEVTRA